MFAGLYGLAPKVLDVLKILKPETGHPLASCWFPVLFAWKSRPWGGRPTISAEVRELTQMAQSAANDWREQATDV